MQWIRTWAVGLCAAAMVVGILLFLKPNAKFAAVFKTALAAFFMAALISPFANGTVNWNSVFSDTEAVEYAPAQDNFVNREIINAAARSVKGEIEKAMQKKHYDYAQIEVSMHMSEQQNITISDIVITGVQEKNAQKVHDYLKRKLGLEVSVKV